MAAAKKTEEITIRKVEYAKCKIRIIGDSPIIIHAWSEKPEKKCLTHRQIHLRQRKSLAKCRSMISQEHCIG